MSEVIRKVFGCIPQRGTLSHGKPLPVRKWVMDCGCFWMLWGNLQHCSFIAIPISDGLLVATNMLWEIHTMFDDVC